MEALAGKTVACDASMAIYQFLIATQTFGKKSAPGLNQLTDKNGNLSGHLTGLFHRTIQFKACGIYPVWVFDGLPPALKSKELDKRTQLKQDAQQRKEAAIAEGNFEMAKKMSQRAFRSNISGVPKARNSKKGRGSMTEKEKSQQT